MEEEIKQLIEKNEQIKDYKKIMSKINKDIKSLNEKVKHWMEENEKYTIEYKGIEIKLIDKHISQSFKKDVIKEKLMEELSAPKEQCEEIADKIVNNKRYITKRVLKLKQNK